MAVRVRCTGGRRARLVVLLVAVLAALVVLAAVFTRTDGPALAPGAPPDVTPCTGFRP